MSIKIGLDAGHGLNTAGKQTPDGIKEWTLNDKVRDIVVAILNEYDVSIVNVDNDEGAVDESLANRLSAYRNAGVKAFVSIHHNAYTGTWNGATGVEVYTDKNPTAQDTKLANLVYNKLVKYTGLKGRGVKKANFHVINQNTIPAILCEGGFMDSTNDYKTITSEAGQNAYAKAVAEGLIEFLGLTKKVAPAPAPTPAQAPAAKKSVEEVAKEVLDGKWGNGEARKTALANAGYNYSEVQAKVNELVKGTETKSFAPYKVKVEVSALNIRSGAGTKHDVTGVIRDKGVYTIVDEKSGWGKLKSGAGWISLGYCKKI